MTFPEFIEKLKNLIPVIETELQSYITQQDEEILDLNRQQLWDGKQSDNNSIQGVYSKFTETISDGETFNFNGQNKRKIEGDVFFLKDTGDFFDTFKLTATKSDLTISANTIKDRTDLLIYGKNLLGISPENTKKLENEFAEYIAGFLNKDYF
jgi:hypothetical protein